MSNTKTNEDSKLTLSIGGIGLVGLGVFILVSKKSVDLMFKARLIYLR